MPARVRVWSGSLGVSVLRTRLVPRSRIVSLVRIVPPWDEAERRSAGIVSNRIVPLIVVPARGAVSVRPTRLGAARDVNTVVNISIRIVRTRGCVAGDRGADHRGVGVSRFPERKL